MREFVVGDKVKILYSKVKENVKKYGDKIEDVFLEQDIYIMSDENNVFTVSYIFNLDEEACPISLCHNGVVFADFRSDELILVEELEEK